MTKKSIGILWFLAQCFSVPVTLIFVRYASQGAVMAVLICIQNFISLLLLVIYFVVTKQPIRTEKIKLHFVRNIFGLGAWVLFFYAIINMPLNSVTAVTFTAPIIATLMAMVFLKEPMHKHRIFGLVIGFIGMLLLLHPDSGVINIYGFMAFIGVISISIAQILMNILNRTEKTIVMVFYMALFSTIMTLPTAIIFWEMPTLNSLFWIALIGIMAIFNVFALVRAIKHAQIGSLMPLDFTRLIWTAIIAYFVFNEKPDEWAIMGATIIIIGTIYTVRKEKNGRLDNNK